MGGDGVYVDNKNNNNNTENNNTIFSKSLLLYIDFLVMVPSTLHFKWYGGNKR